MIAYTFDEYIHIAEDVTLTMVKDYTMVVIFIFRHEYLRSSGDKDTARLMEMDACSTISFRSNVASCSWASPCSSRMSGLWPRHGGGGFFLRRRMSTGWSRRRVGEAHIPVKTEPQLRSWWVMVASTRRYLVESIATAGCVFSLVLLQGNPGSGITGSDGDGALGVVLPFGDIVFGVVVCWWL
jgi:hypothetical protein